MTDRVRHRFAEGRRGVERFVHSREPDYPTGDRQTLHEETLRVPEQVEGVAAELPVVQEFVRGVGFADSRQPKQALRVIRRHPVRVPSEQHDGRAAQSVVRQQPQAAQHRLRFPAVRFLEPASSNGLPHRDRDLLGIEVGDFPSRRRFLLPSPLGMEPLHQHPVVFVRGQPEIRTACPAVRVAAVHVGTGRAGVRRHHDDTPPVGEIHFDDPRIGRRNDPLQLPRDVVERVLPDLLAVDRSIRRHAEQHLPAPVVQHRADRLGGFATLAGRRVEFQRLRLAGGGQARDFFGDHRDSNGSGKGGRPLRLRWRRCFGPPAAGCAMDAGCSLPPPLPSTVAGRAACRERAF